MKNSAYPQLRISTMITIKRIGVGIVGVGTLAISPKDPGNNINKTLYFFIRGPRTLCTIHYIDWNQKKTLNLNSYHVRPKKPIDLKFNTELSFLTKKIKTNPDYSPRAEFEEMMRKKIKSEEPKKESV